MSVLQESGGYPTGAEFDSNAPYNQEDIPEINVDVLVEQTLSLETTIRTNNYSKTIDKEGFWVEYNDKEVRKDALQQVITPSKILETIPEVYNELLNTIDSKYLTKLKLIADACREWIVVDEDVNRI